MRGCIIRSLPSPGAHRCSSAISSSRQGIAAVKTTAGRGARARESPCWAVKRPAVRPTPMCKRRRKEPICTGKRSGRLAAPGGRGQRKTPESDCPGEQGVRLSLVHPLSHTIFS